MSKTFKIDLSNIKKLDSSKNFPLWKLHLENLFWAAGIQEVALGTQARPATDADLQKKWDQENRTAMGLILQTLEEKLTSYVFSCATANSMWNILDQTFGASNKWTKQQLIEEFYQASLKDGTPTELVNTLQTLGGQLSALGYKSIDDEAIIGKVLHELKGPKFDSFVESWDVLLIKDKTITNLVQKLKVHEARHDGYEKEAEVTEKAFSGVKPGGAKGQKKKSANPPQTNPENGNGKKNKKCFNCGKKGHFKAECRGPVKAKGPESTDAKKSEAEPSTSREVEKAFLAKSFMLKCFSTRVPAIRDKVVWYCDSGANVHVTGSLDWFTSYEEFPVPKKLQVATNCIADCPGKGTVTLLAKIANNWEKVDLVDVLYLPGGANLFSQSKMWKKGYTNQSCINGSVFISRDGQESLQAEIDDDGMLVMCFKRFDKLHKALSSKAQRQPRWHERLGHVNFQYLQNSVKKKAVFLGPSDKLENEYKCEVCVKSKLTLQPYPTQTKRDFGVGELLHFDLVHAVSVSNQGNKYFLLLKDHESNFRIAYFQRTKEAAITVPNVMDAVKVFSNQSGNPVKRLKSDKGTEFRNQKLNDFVSEKGIICEFTPTGCSQSNGKIEREVRTVRNMARAMLIEVGLSPAFWQDAVSTAVYTLNRLLSSTNQEKTPYEMLFRRKPNLAHMKIFGCPASARILSPTGEWTTRTREGLLVGNIPETKEFKLWDPTKRVYFTSRHVEFFEDMIPVRQNPQGVGKLWEETLTLDTLDSEEDLRVKIKDLQSKNSSGSHASVESEDDEDKILALIADDDQEEEEYFEVEKDENDPEEDQGKSLAEMMDDEVVDYEEEQEVIPDAPIPPEVSFADTSTASTASRVSSRKNKGIPATRFTFSNVAIEVKNQLDQLAFNDRIPIEPKNYKEAMSCWDRLDWREAIESELNSQLESNTWELVRRPTNRRVLKNMWVFKLKKNPEGGLKYKARLVVKGCSQIYGVDYGETFSPVIRYETVRALIAVGAARNYNFFSFDVSTAFLNSQIDTDVYMEQPEGCKVQGDYVCKLLKGLYGLKQGPLLWHRNIKKKLKEMGFKVSRYDPCLFYYENDTGEITLIIGLYVDDGLMVGNSLQYMEKVLLELLRVFKLTINRNVKKFLGLEISFTETSVQIHQEFYIMEVAERFGLENCKRADIPMSPSHNLEPDTEVNRHDPQLKYQELVGALLFISRCTRPDVSFAVNKLSRYYQCFEEKHWNAAKQILRYLVHTSTHGLSYRKNINISLTGFSDADYAGDKTKLRSTSGIIYMINESPLTWISRRQTLVAQSTTESEYVALATASKEGIWLRNVLCEMRALAWNEPFQIYTDSQSAMNLADNPEVHERTKHIAVRWHFLRWMVESNQLELEYKPTGELVADALTKALPRVPFLEKRDMMNLERKAEEVPKRKAVLSKIVPSKRFSLTLLSLIMFMFVGLGCSLTLPQGSPVVWRKSDEPAVTGFNTVSMKTKLVSPCTLLPTQGLSPGVVKLLRSKCDQQYEHLFRGELEQMCAKKSMVSRRPTREIFTVIALISIFCVASAGVGLGAYAIHKTDQLEISQMEIERTMDDLEQKVKINSEGLIFLKDEVRKIGVTMNKIIDDVNLFKEKAVEVQYIIAYIVSRLLVGRGVIWETKRNWKKKRMDESLFEFLNLTLPCNASCPMEYAEFKRCSFDETGTFLNLDFAVPMVNPNLTIVKVDPFFLMKKMGNQTCRMTYRGPQNALISLDEDCLYAVGLGLDYRGKILFSPSTSCSKYTLSNEENLFVVEKCVASKAGEESDFIQVKVYNMKFHIYCPGMSFTYGTTRDVKCPNYVFQLPMEATFTLNNVTFKGELMKLVYEEKEDPLMMEKLAWHLTPSVNWDELNRTFTVLEPLNPNHWHHDDFHFWIIVGVVVAFILLVSIMCFLMRGCGCRPGQSTSTNKINRRTPKKGTNDIEMKKKNDAASVDESIRG